MSHSKTNTVVEGNNYMKHSIKIGTEQLQQVSEFKCLASVISQDGKFDEKIKERQGAAGRFFNSIKTTPKNRRRIEMSDQIFWACVGYCHTKLSLPIRRRTLKFSIKTLAPSSALAFSPVNLILCKDAFFKIYQTIIY